jgi:hypothetical protein
MGFGEAEEDKDIEISIFDIVDGFGGDYTKIFIWLLKYLTNDPINGEIPIDQVNFESINDILLTLPSSIYNAVNAHEIEKIDALDTIFKKLHNKLHKELLLKNILLIILTSNANCTYGYDNGFNGALNMAENMIAKSLVDDLLGIDEDETPLFDLFERSNDGIVDVPTNAGVAVSQSLQVGDDSEDNILTLTDSINALPDETETDERDEFSVGFILGSCMASAETNIKKNMLYKPTYEYGPMAVADIRDWLDSLPAPKININKKLLQHKIFERKCSDVFGVLNYIVNKIEKRMIELEQTRSIEEEKNIGRRTQLILETEGDIIEIERRYQDQKRHEMRLRSAQVRAGSKKNKKYTRKIKKSRISSQKLNSRRKYKHKTTSKQTRKRIYEKSSNSKQRRTRKIRK